MHNAIELGLLEHGLREVERFEDLFAGVVGARWAVAVNSGLSALTVALHILDPVTARIPSWSCVAVRNAAQAIGFDVDYLDTSFDVTRAFATITGDPNVVTHMFGRPTGYAATGPVVVDCTLSLGGVRHPLGTFSLNHHGGVGVCSTYETKMISTGRGGVIFGNDESLHERVSELVHYETHTGFGYSVAMSSMQAALGVSQLAQLDGFIERRRELAARYTEAFGRPGSSAPISTRQRFLPVSDQR
jgi:perosamine synthetase